MAEHADVLFHTMTAQLPTGQRVRVIARYDALDPLVLLFRFVGARRGVDWLFSRDLLIEALLMGNARDGDIQFHADESDVDYLWLVLDSPSGHAELRSAVGELTDLVGRIHYLVPANGAPVHGDTALRTFAEWGM